MAGNKNAADLTDEELAALSPEELAELQGDNHEGEDEETDEEREAREAAEAEAAKGGKDDLDPDAVAALAAEGGEGGEGRSPMVPHSRFQEVNEERRLLLEEVIRLRKEGGTAPAKKEEPAAPAYDFKKARKEYHALLLEDPEKAAEKLDEIEDAREAQHKADIEAAEQRAEDRAFSRMSSVRTTDNAATAAQKLYAAYPFLDANSDDADETAIYAVIGKRDQLIRGGEDPVEAMRKAAEEVGAKFAKLLGTGAAAGADDGKPSARAVEATRKAADAAGRQPATPKGGIGNRAGSDKLDINNLTDEQLEKMPPDELKKLRGDFRLPA